MTTYAHPSYIWCVFFFCWFPTEFFKPMQFSYQQGPQTPTIKFMHNLSLCKRTQLWCVCIFTRLGLQDSQTVVFHQKATNRGLWNEYAGGSEMAMSTVPHCVGIYNLPITAHAYIQLPGCLIHECLEGILIMWEYREYKKQSRVLLCECVYMRVC